MLHCYYGTVFIQIKLEATSCRCAIFLKILKKMGNEVKKVEKHWFMILCRQQQKVKAKYFSVTNAGNEEIN